MDWLVMAWVEWLPSQVLLSAPGIKEWDSQRPHGGLGLPPPEGQPIDTLIRESGRLSMKWDHEGWFKSQFNERFLRVVMFPAHAFPTIAYPSDGEWEFADVTERRDILAFRECAGSDVAAEECKRMQELYGPQVDEADNKTYEAHSRALREDYETLRKYVAKTYPHLPPMPEPEADVFAEPIEEDEVTT
jgi:hypothetical protein